MTLRPIQALLLLLLPLPGLALAAVERTIDAETGLRAWAWREAGVSLQLVQRLPDQTRGFFLARGFSAEAVERIANACVFQTIFRNESDQPLDYSLDDWRVVQPGVRTDLVTRERWDAAWQAGEASEASRIALRWALLPTRQRFEPGDYNWGMTAFGLAPGMTFELELVVRHGDDQVVRTVDGIECAPDREGN